MQHNDQPGESWDTPWQPGVDLQIQIQISAKCLGAFWPTSDTTKRESYFEMQKIFNPTNIKI